MKLFTAIVKCRDCGNELNRATKVPGADYTRIVMSAPLNVGPCSKGCRSTDIDCNANITLDWFEEAGDQLMPVSKEYVVAEGKKAA